MRSSRNSQRRFTTTKINVFYWFFVVSLVFVRLIVGSVVSVSIVAVSLVVVSLAVVSLVVEIEGTVTSQISLQ